MERAKNERFDWEIGEERRKEMVKTYDDFCNSTSLDRFVDYNNREESTITRISKLVESETIEDEDIKAEDKIESENSILFRGCMYGMLVAFAIMLFAMNFIKELMY